MLEEKIAARKVNHMRTLEDRCQREGVSAEGWDVDYQVSANTRNGHFVFVNRSLGILRMSYPVSNIGKVINKIRAAAARAPAEDAAPAARAPAEAAAEEEDAAPAAEEEEAAPAAEAADAGPVGPAYFVEGATEVEVNGRLLVELLVEDDDGEKAWKLCGKHDQSLNRVLKYLIDAEKLAEGTRPELRIGPLALSARATFQDAMLLYQRG